MEQVELKVRVIFATAALVALLAFAANALSVLGGDNGHWTALLISSVGIWLASIEALGYQRLGASISTRLLVSVAVGVACLALAEI